MLCLLLLQTNCRHIVVIKIITIHLKDSTIRDIQIFRQQPDSRGARRS